MQFRSNGAEAIIVEVLFMSSVNLLEMVQIQPSNSSFRPRVSRRTRRRRASSSPNLKRVSVEFSVDPQYHDAGLALSLVGIGGTRWNLGGTRPILTKF
jgi:hypothetical protein